MQAGYAARPPLVQRAAGLALLGLVSGCAIVDRPILALRSVAGGIHNKRQASGIRPFFLADGRLGLAANGALVVEREPGGEFVALTNCFAEIDDPDPAPDGRSIVVASGREQVTAGGGHNDHVFQLYLVDPETREWHRLTRSHRAESLPRFTADGGHVVFVRRAEYDGWSLDDPWGPGSIFVVAADGTDERRLTEGLFHPFDGLELVARDTRVVFGALPEGSTEPSVFALDFPAGGEPRLLIEDAYLPTPIPGTEEHLVARVHEDGHGIARIDLEGRVLREYPLRANELLGLAIAPDGQRIAFSDFDPDGGQFGEVRLWMLAEDGAEPVLRERLPHRATKCFKPLDVVKPPSWWFHPSASPGSR